MYVIGIDGGGTKTVAVIANQQGAILAKTVVGRSNPTTLTQAAFEEVITLCMTNLRAGNETAFAEVTCCFAGLSGVIEMGYEAIFEATVKQFFAHEVLIKIENDACIALYSGTLGKEGIVQIAGTGSITYCLDAQHKSVRSGGWGYLFDDEGSGYDIANQALKAVVKAYDHRGPETSLTSTILHHFDIQKVEDIIDKIYSTGHPRTIIAPLSRYVEAAAIAGDAVALQIMETICRSYLVAIDACQKQTSWPADREIPVVLAGGIFTNFDFFETMLTQLIANSTVHYTFIQPKIQPIGGAVIGALQSMDQPLDAQFIMTFNTKYNGL